jgi:hypothetical protein
LVLGALRATNPRRRRIGGGGSSTTPPIAEVAGGQTTTVTITNDPTAVTNATTTTKGDDHGSGLDEQHGARYQHDGYAPDAVSQIDLGLAHSNPTPLSRRPPPP